MRKQNKKFGMKRSGTPSRKGDAAMVHSLVNTKQWVLFRSSGLLFAMLQRAGK